MKTPPSKNFTPPSDNASFAIISTIAWLVFFGISAFASLNGASWLWSYALALLLGIFGCGLLFYAKLPLYRNRRFLTWGIKSIPLERHAHYRWGKRLAWVSVILLTCLFLFTRHGLHPYS